MIGVNGGFIAACTIIAKPDAQRILLSFWRLQMQSPCEACLTDGDRE